MPISYVTIAALPRSLFTFCKRAAVCTGMPDGRLTRRWYSIFCGKVLTDTSCDDDRALSSPF